MMEAEKKLIDVTVAKGYVQSFIADPILKMAANAVLDNAPRVDAVGVVHGEWDQNDDDIDLWYECSVCGATAPLQSNYCPNCGAKMDGERNDANGRPDC